RLPRKEEAPTGPASRRPGGGGLASGPGGKAGERAARRRRDGSSAARPLLHTTRILGACRASQPSGEPGGFRGLLRELAEGAGSRLLAQRLHSGCGASRTDGKLLFRSRAAPYRGKGEAQVATRL